MVVSERDAKATAHAWARALRSKEDRGSTAKLIAWVLADRATVVTPELARTLGLGPELVGTLAAWPGVHRLAEEIGLSDERTTRRQLGALTTRDLVVHERRHLRLSSVYVLAVDGVPVRVDETGATGAIAPVERVSDRGDRPGREEATGAIAPVDGRIRPGRSRQSDRGDRPGEKNIEKNNSGAAARASTCAGTSADTRVREAAEAVEAAWVELAGEPPDRSADVLDLAARCVEQAELGGGAPAEHARDAIAGFFAERTDVRRPRPAWVAERFGRYLARGQSARSEGARLASAEERRRRALEEHERARRASVEAAQRAAERRVDMPVAAAARGLRRAVVA